MLKRNYLIKLLKDYLRDSWGGVLHSELRRADHETLYRYIEGYEEELDNLVWEAIRKTDFMYMTGVIGSNAPYLIYELYKHTRSYREADPELLSRKGYKAVLDFYSE